MPQQDRSLLRINAGRPLWKLHDAALQANCNLLDIVMTMSYMQVNANQAELQELEATEQHLKRQQASLTDRLSRLENQSALKREAAASAVEEQLKEKEAIEAENAAARAKTAENEAMVSDCAFDAKHVGLP